MHIREIRRWKRITGRMITQKTGISPHRLSEIENGYPPWATDDEKKLLAEAVGVPIEKVEFEPPEGVEP